jgi:four helix bundle protein
MEVKYRAFYLSINVIKFMDLLSYKQSIRIISDQLIRSVTSIGANIVEAKSSSSKREFLNYFQISLKSANETKYWLALLDKLLPDKSKEISIFVKEVNEISKIIGSSILTMKRKRQL